MHRSRVAGENHTNTHVYLKCPATLPGTDIQPGYTTRKEFFNSHQNASLKLIDISDPSPHSYTNIKFALYVCQSLCPVSRNTPPDLTFPPNAPTGWTRLLAPIAPLSWGIPQPNGAMDGYRGV